MKIVIRALVPLGTDAVKPLMPGEVGTIERDQEQIDKALSLGLYEVIETIAEDAPVVVEEELPQTGIESDPAPQDVG
jgi:hypothetical protein